MSVINEVGLLELVGAALIRNISQVNKLKLTLTLLTEPLAPSPSIYSFKFLGNFTKIKEE